MEFFVEEISIEPVIKELDLVADYQVVISDGNPLDVEFSDLVDYLGSEVFEFCCIDLLEFY